MNNDEQKIIDEERRPIVGLIENEQATGQTKELYEKMNGKPPKWVKAMANCEDTLISFLPLFYSLMDDEPASESLKWKVAHIVSKINQCEFCISATKDKILGFGATEEDIPHLERIATEKEKIAMLFAKEATEHAYNIDPKLIEQIKENFTDGEFVEIASVVGLFNYLNRFNDALRILPD